MNRKIGLIILLVAIAASIWYLESIKIHTAENRNGNSQAISLPEQNGSSSAAENLQAIASEDSKAGYAPAKEISDPTGFVNTTSTFTLKSLIGKKVVLLDFWTYSCINCIRTLPYLTAWYQKYRDMGLEIVGIHTPEFEFEKDINNVRMAAQKYGIEYPVVLDSNHGTWDAYNNLYWPHEYLIDIAGYVVHDHIGEGGYDETEGVIQKLLGERATALATQMPKAAPSLTVAPPDLSGIASPETYFGAARNEYLGNGTEGAVGVQTLKEPQNISPNSLYLAGNWNFSNEYATNVESGAKIIYKYHSAKVYLVASAPAGATVEVFQDGKLVSANAGGDVKNGKVTIKESRLYSLVNNPDGSGEHTLELIIEAPGLQAYTFTFG